MGAGALKSSKPLGFLASICHAMNCEYQHKQKFNADRMPALVFVDVAPFSERVADLPQALTKAICLGVGVRDDFNLSPDLERLEQWLQLVASFSLFLREKERLQTQLCSKCEAHDGRHSGLRLVQANLAAGFIRRQERLRLRQWRLRVKVFAGFRCATHGVMLTAWRRERASCQQPL